MKDREKEVVVVEHQFDTNGNIIKHDYKAIPNELWIDVKNEILSDTYRMKNENLFVPTTLKTYELVKQKVDDFVENKQLV